ncbi:S-layer homology domain-containing protein [Paenibacillus sp. 1P03SA]|uniref:S-layer homology domain-containing protein n=1 Tax=Paenibacillus sp. 1P03SA TaxID=3132294 RepID=UPI0039A1A885
MVFWKKSKSSWGAAIFLGTAALFPHDAKAVGLPDEPAAAVQTGSFSDVGGHWAEKVIRQAAGLDLVQGYSDGTFHPDGKITRAEFAAMLNRATKQKADGVEAESTLPGLQNHWSQKEVTKLAAIGFIDRNDYRDGFSPDRELTRYEMIKWISSGLVQSEPSFKQALEDSEGTLLPTPETYKGGISGEQIPYVALVKGTGIVDGFEDGTFRLAQATTRAEVSAILLRFMEVEGSKAEQYKALNELREVGVTGSNVLSITKYLYSKNFNNEEASFDKIKNKEITLKNNIAKMKVKRIIFIDTIDTKASGVYAQMFLDQVEKYQYNRYIAVSEISVISNLDKIDPNTLANGMGNGITSATRLSDASATRYGVPTIPLASAAFFKKGVENSVWVIQTMPKIPPNNREYISYSITTDSGDNGGIILRK